MATCAAPATTTSKIQEICAAPLLRVLFDAPWYLATYPDAVQMLEDQEWMTALDHYLAIGADDGRAATPYFDAEWYLTTYREVDTGPYSNRFLDALHHYLATGCRSGHCPNPVFDERWYGARNSFDRMKYVNGYHHFLVEGAAAGRSPSPLFDENWYRKRYPDVAAAIAQGFSRSAYHDYVRRPAWAERGPCPYFDPAWYRGRHGGQGSAQRPAYFQFLERGAAAGHSPGPYFEELWYRASYTDVAQRIASGDLRSAYHHYLYQGAWLNYAPTPYFLPAWYLSWYADARERVQKGEFEHAYQHYLGVGARQGFSPNLYFDETWYLHRNPDVRAAVTAGDVVSGHEHYLGEGANDARESCTLFDSAWYLAAHTEVKEYIANGLAASPYDHFCRYGLPAEYSSCPDFDERWYLEQHPEVVREVAEGHWISGLHHFVVKGLIDGFAPRPALREDRVERNVPATVRARRELREFLGKRKELHFANPGDPLVSIILILYNRAELTLRCLRSIADWADEPYEVIVVDNHSLDQTQELLRQVGGLNVIRNQRNLHFLEAGNQAAQAARGKYILFLNNDSELQVEALSSAVRVLRKTSDVGAVSAKIILHNGALQEAGSFLLPNGFSEQFGRGQQPFASEYMHQRDVPYGSGAFLITPRELFLQMGGFDNTFHPAYFEDVDYCLRLWRRGLRVVFNPDSMILHHETGSSKYHRFLYPPVLRNAATLRHRHPEYFDGLPDYKAAPLPVRDGKQLRTAQLLLVDDISTDRLTQWLPLIRRHLARKVFLTIYPMAPWDGDRNPLNALGLEEVEIVAERGLADLEQFCRRRERVYKDVIVLAASPEALAGLHGLHQWLPEARVFSSASA